MSEQRASILIVDDEFSVRDSLFHWFSSDGHQVEAAENATHALRLLGERRYDLVLLDIKMPGMDGIELQARIHDLDPTIAVIMITAFASVDTAVQTLKQGAFDYVTKPIDPDELSHLVAHALEHRRLRDDSERLRESTEDLSGAGLIVGESPQIREVIEHIGEASQTDVAVLITGESGTGKELVARAVHASSARRYSPIVPVSCAALPDDLWETELFGHEKGAFSGARYRRKGKLEMAHGGTLLLNEIGTLGVRAQVELLAVLGNQQFRRLGATRSIDVDFRLISTTSEDLAKAVEQGRLREDIYYRINVLNIAVPPLRQRPSDIPLLAKHFLRRLSVEMDKQFDDIEEEAMTLLCEHDWPGNVRELANAVERALAVGSPPVIQAADLPLGARSSWPGNGLGSLADMERAHIARVLEGAGWNITRSADILGIDRTTLYSKIKKYGLQK